MKLIKVIKINLLALLALPLLLLATAVIIGDRSTNGCKGNEKGNCNYRNHIGGVCHCACV